MRKFEIYPDINYSNIKAIKATIELTEEEVALAKNMDKKEFASFVKGKAHVQILDWEVNLEAGTLSNWNDITENFFCIDEFALGKERRCETVCERCIDLKI
jgi:hypothetical protein